MKPTSKNTFFSPSTSLVLSTSLVILATALNASAAFTWDGGAGTDNPATAANWNPDVAPNGTGSLNGIDVEFGAAALGSTNTMNFNTGGNSGSWTFLAAAPAMTINLNSNQMGAASGPNVFVNNSAFTQTFTGTPLLFDIGGTTTTRTFDANTAAISMPGFSVRGDAAPASWNIEFKGSATGSVSTGNWAGAGGPLGSKTIGIIKNGTGSWTLQGIIANIGATAGTGVTVNAGTLTLSGANTYTGATTVNGGTLLLNKTGTGAISASSALVLGGGNFSLLGATTGTTTQTVASLAGSVGGIIITPNGGTSTTLTITSNTISGTSGVNFNTSAGTPSTAIVAWNPTLTNNIIAGGYTITDNAGTGFATITGSTVTRYTAATALTSTNPTVATTNLSANTTGTITNTVTAAALNSLSIDTTAGANTWDLVSGNTATITTGGILMTGANDFSILNGTLNSNTATNSNLTINQFGAGKMTIGSVIANGIGNSTVIKNGSGTLVLSGANIYTGSTIINGGTLLNGSATTFTNKGTLTMSSTGTLDLGGFNAAFTNIAANTVGNTITNNGASDAVITSTTVGSTINALVTDGSKKLGVIFGPNSNTGTNAFNLASANTFSGGIVLAPDTTTLSTNATRLRLTGGTITGTPLGTGTITIGVTALDRAGLLIDALTGTNTITNDFVVNTIQGPEAILLNQQGIRVDNNATNVTFTGKLTAGLTNVSFAGNGAATASGKITGVTNGFQTTSSVAITLNNTSENNDYAGSTLIQNTSKIILGRANQIPNASPVTISGGTLDVAGFSDIVGAVTLASGSINGSGGILTGASYDLQSGSVSAILGGSGIAVTKTTAGTVTLTGANSYSGTTAINGGTLFFNRSAATANNTINVGSGVTVASGATLQFQGGAGAFTNTISAPISVTGNGSAYSLEFPSGNAQTFSLTGGLAVTNGAIIRAYGLINNYNFNTVGITGDATTSGLVFRTDGGNTAGQAHTYGINVASTYTGNTTLQAITQQGVIKIGANDALPTTTSLDLMGGTSANTTASLDLNGKTQTLTGITASSNAVRTNVINSSATASTITINNSANVSMAGILGGTGTNNNNFGLTKSNTGTFTLSAANTYTGATQVNAGTILVSGSLANTAVTVGGATATGTPTLAGGGTIGGATVIAAAGSGVVGTHSPGVVGVANGVGTQTFSSTLNYDTGSIFEWNLNAASASDPGAAASNAATGTYDQVVAAGAVTGGAAIFKVVLGGNAFTDAFWQTDKSWTNIYSGAGTPANLAAVFSSFSPTGSLDSSGVVAGIGQFTFNGSTSTLNWSAVPEPSSALAGLLIGAGLLRRRRSA